MHHGRPKSWFHATTFEPDVSKNPTAVSGNLEIVSLYTMFYLQYLQLSSTIINLPPRIAMFIGENDGPWEFWGAKPQIAESCPPPAGNGRSPFHVRGPVKEMDELMISYEIIGMCREYLGSWGGSSGILKDHQEKFIYFPAIIQHQWIG